MMDGKGQSDVVHPLRDERRNRLAAAQAAASRISMQAILGDENMRKQILGEAVKPDRVCAIFDGERVLGVLGFTVNGEDFTHIRLRLFLRHFGPVSGLVRYAAYKVVKRLYFGPALYIAAFWVDPKERGGGFGQKLLAELLAISANRNMPIWTDVKIGNEKAYRFYEKNGFKPQEGFLFTSLLPRLMGYRRVYRNPDV